MRVGARRHRPSTPSSASKSGGGPAKVTSIVCAFRWRSSASVPSSTRRPARRMPTRSHSASTSLRMCDDRNTAWPRSFASFTVSRNATSISGSRPLVGSSSSSRSARVENAWTSWTFCRLPFDRARTFLSVRPGTARAADRGRRRRRRRAPGRGTRASPRSVSDGHNAGSPAMYATRRWAATGSRQASIPNSSAEPLVGRCKPEQPADRRRLAGAVRSEEAVDLAGLDVQVELVERQRRPRTAS